METIANLHFVSSLHENLELFSVLEKVAGDLPMIIFGSGDESIKQFLSRGKLFIVGTGKRAIALKLDENFTVRPQQHAAVYEGR